MEKSYPAEYTLINYTFLDIFIETLGFSEKFMVKKEPLCKLQNVQGLFFSVNIQTLIQHDPWAGSANLSGVI